MKINPFIYTVTLLFFLVSCSQPHVSSGTSTESAVEAFPQIISGVITHGPRDKKEIALTFDAEMTAGMKRRVLNGGSSFDAKIIDVLNTTHTKATIFLTGMWIELYPDVAKQLAANPLFELANHSYFDEAYTPHCFKLTRVDENKKEEHITKTQQLIHDLAGRESNYFRFPGGCYSQKDVELVKKLGLSVVHWDVVANDGFNNDPAKITQTVLKNTQNGSIIVLHLNGPPSAPKTAEALPTIISEFKKKGFAFVTVSELLRND